MLWKVIVYSLILIEAPMFKRSTHILQSGDIAKHLDLVSHNVRTRLDELKRQELERLRNIVRMQIRQRNGKYASYTHLERAW